MRVSVRKVSCVCFACVCACIRSFEFACASVHVCVYVRMCAHACVFALICVFVSV